MPETGDGGEPAPSRWPVFGVVGLSLLMPSIDQTAVATALPTIEQELGAPLAWSAWTITIYVLGQIIAMPIAGRLADQFGRKKVFLAAVALFTLASLASGMADHIALLIGSRALQGLATGGILPSATGLVADQFGRNRDRAIGMFSSIFPIGAIVGPLVGGILLANYGWRWIFLINLPVGVVMTALGAWLITDHRVRVGERVDGVGIVLLTTMILAGMTAITLAGLAHSAPWQLPLGVGSAAIVAGACGWLFVRHSRGHRYPIVPHRLLRERPFATMNGINVVFGGSAMGMAALVPLYAQQHYGLAPLAAGGLLAARALGMIVTSGATVVVMRRLGSRNLMAVGFALNGIGLLLLAFPAQGSVTTWLIVSATVMGLGMGISSPSTNNAALHLAPDDVSAATGVRGLFRKSGAILMVSVTTSLLTVADQQGPSQGWIFAGYALILIATVGVVLRLPDHRGSW